MITRFTKAGFITGNSMTAKGVSEDSYAQNNTAAYNFIIRKLHKQDKYYQIT